MTTDANDRLAEEILEELRGEEVRKAKRLRLGEVVIPHEDRHYTLSGIRFVTGGRAYAVEGVHGDVAVVAADIPGETAHLGLLSFTFADEVCITCRSHARQQGSLQCYRCVPSPTWGSAPDWEGLMQQAAGLEDVQRVYAAMLLAGLQPISWRGVPRWGRRPGSLRATQHDTFTRGDPIFSWDTRTPCERQLVLRRTAAPEGTPYLFIERRIDIHKGRS